MVTKRQLYNMIIYLIRSDRTALGPAGRNPAIKSPAYDV